MGTSSGLTTAASFDLDATAAQVAALGRGMTDEVITASRAIYEPFHEREPYAGVRVTRDVTYGPHPRQRLDVFAPEGAPGDGIPADRPLPVLMFFHGGGFVRGDKHLPGTPYQSNVGVWAVRHGLVGVNVTYRMAPESMWPSGAEDVAAALAWVRANVGEHGGDGDQVYLMGTSAGAAHVASYLAHSEFHLSEGVGAAGGILLSGAYDFPTFEPELLGPYLGEDRGRYDGWSPLRGLVEEPMPLLFALAEYDLPGADRQALELVRAWWERHGRWPHLVRLMGHNHFTATMHLNTPDGWLGRQILRFAAQRRASG